MLHSEFLVAPKASRHSSAVLLLLLPLLPVVVGALEMEGRSIGDEQRVGRRRQARRKKVFLPWKGSQGKDWGSSMGSSMGKRGGGGGGGGGPQVVHGGTVVEGREGREGGVNKPAAAIQR